MTGAELFLAANAGTIAAVGTGIAAEDKISVVKRLGRSPDKADALVMAWYRGVTGAFQRGLYGASEPGGSPYKVIHAYEQRKKRYRR